MADACLSWCVWDMSDAVETVIVAETTDNSLVDDRPATRPQAPKRKTTNKWTAKSS